MKKKSLLLFIITLTKGVLLHSQEITIKGKVEDNVGIVKNVNILNTESKKGIFSDDEGYFSLKVKLGDKLEFTSIQHYKKEVYIDLNTIKTKALNIKLQSKDYLLDEVEIKKTLLSGTLAVDTKFAKETKREEVMKNLGFNPYIKKKSQIERKIHTASTSSGIIPLGLLINTLSGRMRVLKKQREIAENETKMTYIDKNYRTHIIHDLKIDSINVDRFIYFMHLDKNFKEVYKKGDMKLIPFLKEQAILFKRDSL
ncbi:carboxypeptidase-like regulatory domain-containing protein [Tenacibaculum sp. 190524A05c]|uniref:Carboxypeptidase-like protein n=1 Tax=Tenacibaculum platacis TaxID=3137852 RepID=A0ABM9P1L0_9FLAO